MNVRETSSNDYSLAPHFRISNLRVRSFCGAECKLVLPPVQPCPQKSRYQKDSFFLFLRGPLHLKLQGTAELRYLAPHSGHPRRSADCRNSTFDLGSGSDRWQELYIGKSRLTATIVSAGCGTGNTSHRTFPSPTIFETVSDPRGIAGGEPPYSVALPADAAALTSFERPREGGCISITPGCVRARTDLSCTLHRGSSLSSKSHPRESRAEIAALPPPPAIKLEHACERP